MSGEQNQDPNVDQGQPNPEAATAQSSNTYGEEELAARIQEAVSLALSEQRDSVLRAQAEVQNMRRRCETDVEKAHKFALEKFSSELLPVLDNLERALGAVPDTQLEQVKGLYEGVELTLKGFLETLAKFNVKQLNPHGEPFDPQSHQAIAQVPNPAVAPNTVIDVMQKGYSLNGRVIRPAMVVVSKAS
jgi:molecular chaperone GrpE